MTQIAMKFVQWDVPELDGLKDSKVYRLRERLNNGDKLTREEKNWLTRNVWECCRFRRGIALGDTLFFSRCCIPDSLSRISVARFEIFVVIPEEFCLYRGVVDHFQLAAIQAVDYFSIFFRQLEIKLYKNKAMNFNLFQSRDSRRFFSRVSVLPELKYIFICRLRDGVVPAVILLSE